MTGRAPLATARRVAGRARRGIRRLRGQPAVPTALDPLSGWARLLLDGTLEAGPRGTVLFAVDDPARVPGRNRAAPARVQLDAAVGLAAELARHGYGVGVRTPQRWAELPPRPTAAVLALSPRFDPALVPADVVCLAWVLDEPDTWLRQPRLPACDGVLAGSAIMARRLARLTDAPVHLLPLAADLSVPVRPRDKHRPVAAPAPAAAAAGLVAPEVLRLVAAGDLPITSSRLGLAALGLDEVPVYRSAGDRGRRLGLLHADRAGSAVLSARLRAALQAGHTWAHRARTLDALLEQTPVGRRGAPPAITFFPDFRVTNPYQEMLYSALPAAGIATLPLRDATVAVLPRRLPQGSLAGYALHLHWTSAVVQVAGSPAEAQARLEAFRALVLDLRARGGRLLWTVHNVLPHELTYREPELELCRFLAENADLVHVMGEETFALTEPHFTLDRSRAVLVPHSSYLGVYPDVLTREQARERLGLAEDDVALLCLGGLRPYRGMDLMLDAFDRLREHDPRLRLLVAGKPGDAPQVAHWRQRCEADPRVVARFGHVPECDLQIWNRAADVAVLPYRAILNSGAFKLAQTFGLPVVAPRAGALRAEVDAGRGFGFDPDDPHTLDDAIRAAVEVVGDPERAAQARAASLAAAAAYPPEAMARDFLAAVAPLLIATTTTGDDGAAAGTAHGAGSPPAQTRLESTPATARTPVPAHP